MLLVVILLVILLVILFVIFLVILLLILLWLLGATLLFLFNGKHQYEEKAQKEQVMHFQHAEFEVPDRKNAVRRGKISTREPQKY